jgi:hypothetical protein
MQPIQVGGQLDVPAGAPELAGHSRNDALRRLEKKRAWTRGFVVYCVVNAFLIVLWAITGGGYFWPAWVLGGWGIAQVLGYWDAFARRPITEADIDTEMRRR